jgi:hypothetical protein
MDKILLGFTVGKGEPVYIKLHHLAIFGMTQLSGKTTTLEALISRSGLRAIAFKTKRGESGFHSQSVIPPFYKTRSDWQYVEGLVGVALQEKVKYEPGMRSGIMKACQGAQDLKGIQRNAKTLSQTSRSEFMRSVFERLVAYLDIVIPELERWTFTTEISLNDGINVMDLVEMRLETQQLVIASTIEHAFTKLDHTIIIIPEAWEMIPELRTTPVKLVAEQFIRKGATIGNYLWIDSQDIGGISKIPLRQCDNWIMGRMKEAHEVERILKQLLGVKIPKEEIQTLPLGHFYAVIGESVKKVYVLPVGVPEKEGQRVAMRKTTPEAIRDKYMKIIPEPQETDITPTQTSVSVGNAKPIQNSSWKEPFDAIKVRVEGLFLEVRKLACDIGSVAGEITKTACKQDIQALATRIEKCEKDIVEAKAAFSVKSIPTKPTQEESETINLEHKEITVNLTHSNKIIEMTTDDIHGRIMFCAIHDLPKDGFDEMQMTGAMADRGWRMERILLALHMDKLNKVGRLLKISTQKPYRYRLPSKISINVKEGA